MVTEPDRSAVRQLCTEVLAGHITLDDFYARRPEGLDAFLELVLDDLEDGILHTPGRFFRGGLDRPAWERSPEYFTVYLDCCLLGDLGAQHTSAELLRCRTVIDGSLSEPTRERIQEAVERCLAQDGGVSD